MNFLAHLFREGEALALGQVESGELPREGTWVFAVAYVLARIAIGVSLLVTAAVFVAAAVWCAMT